MLTWMHDGEVVNYLMKDFAAMTLDDCISFIEDAKRNRESIHLAIIDDNNAYHGTVSLKRIIKGTAEFGIVIDRNAQGTGLAAYAMREMLRIGFEVEQLKCIYWCLHVQNQRAKAFYLKNKYRIVCVEDLTEVVWRDYVEETYKEFNPYDLIWFEQTLTEWKETLR